MENKSHALLAGLFALTLGLAAIVAVWWFGGRHEQTNEYVVATTWNVTGLSVQGQVRYRGIRVGKVLSIDLDEKDPRNTLVRISVRSTVPITKGVFAKLGYQGLTGIAHVLLEDGGLDATPLTDSTGERERIPMRESLLQGVTDQGAEVLRSARDFLASANQVLSPENRQNITKTLSNLEATTANAREALAQIRKLLTAENVQRINTVISNMEKTSGQTEPLLVEARGLLVRLQSLSDKLEATLGDSSTGGAGALVTQINGLTNELSSNSRQLNRVLLMLEDSPQSLIYGAPPTMPGPGEAGFVVPQNAVRQP